MTAEAFAKESYAPMPIEALSDSPLNPRKTFPEAGLKDLAESIRSKGILEPLIGRTNGKPGHVEIICGARRLRAARLAGLKSVPVIVRPYSDADAMEVMAIENLQREDVAPLEEAAGYEALLKLGKYDSAKLAAKIGKSVRHVEARLQLLKVGEDVKHLLEAGTIGAELALEIARLPKDWQAKAVQFAVRADIRWDDDRRERHETLMVSSVADFRKWVKRVVYRELKDAPFEIKDPTLCGKAGACVGCPKRTAAAPNLFDDGTADACLDHACWDRKVQLNVARKRKELEAAGGKVVEVTTQSRYQLSGAETKRVEAGELVPDGSWGKAKPNAKEAVQALVVDGPDAGSVIAVKIAEHAQPKKKAAAKKDGEAKPERSLAERRKALASRRVGKALVALSELVEKTGFDAFEKANGAHWAPRLLALAGTLYRGRGASYDGWKKFETLAPEGGKPDLAKPGAVLWSYVRTDLADQLSFQNLEYAAKQALKAPRIAKLCGLEWSALLLEAEKELPEPPGWTKAKAEKPAEIKIYPAHITAKKAAKADRVTGGYEPEAVERFVQKIGKHEINLLLAHDRAQRKAPWRFGYDFRTGEKAGVSKGPSNKADGFASKDAALKHAHDELYVHLGLSSTGASKSEIAALLDWVEKLRSLPAARAESKPAAPAKKVNMGEWKKSQRAKAKPKAAKRVKGKGKK